MLVLVVALGFVAVGLAIALVLARRQVAESATRLARTEAARDVARDYAETAVERADAMAKERDDALERVSRARRDAAEVANRLQEETAARAEADAARMALEDERDAHECAPGDLDSEVLWALALSQAERTWRISLALGADDRSPLVGADGLFRAAVEIEVDAVREESGADVELRWEEPCSEPSAARAVLAWSVVRDVITRYATTADRIHLRLASTPSGIELCASATGPDGAELPVVLPGPLEVAPGRVAIS